MTALPNGWSTATLDELNDAERPICYGILKPGPDLDDGVPYVKVKNIRGERIDVGSLNRTSPEIDSQYRRSRLRAGDLLISIRGTYGRVAPVPTELESANITQDSARIAPVGVHADYLQKFLQGPSAQQFFAEVARGVAVKGVNIGDLRQTPIHLPPAPEQARIVVAIDEAFSTLEAGEAGLHTARQLLKRMRDAILAAAVSGRLVPQERTDTPATKLLADLGIAPVDQEELPSLPAGWAWAAIERVAATEPNALAIGPFGSNLKVTDYADDGVPLVFVRNIRRRDFRAAPKYVTHEKAKELASHSVVKGDVLITKMGDPPGDTAVYTESAAIITADCIKVTCGPSVTPEYMCLAIAGGHTRRLVLEATRGVAQKKVSLGRFRVLPIPIPPVEEQARIVAEVERQMSFIDACDRAIDAGLTRAAALRRSVLKAAFEGRLVPQDPTDEPASVLLERIRDERAAAPIARSRRAGAKA